MLTRDEAIELLTAPGLPHELANALQHGRECKVFQRSQATLRELYETSRSDVDFYVYEDERYTYEQAWQQAARIATLLVTEYGIVTGDRVAISMRNYPEWVFSFMAATSIGAIAVGLNALWQPDEMLFALNDCGAKVLIADQERLDRLEATTAPEGLAVLAVRPTKELAGGVVDLADAITMINPVMPDAEIDPQDDALIFYTSGSTGHPKGAVSSHRAVISALLSWEVDDRVASVSHGEWTPGLDPEPPRDQPILLLTVPLFHVSGLHVVLLNSFRSQRRVVAMYRWDAGRAAELIERERVNVLLAPPAITGDVVAHALTSGNDLSSLVVVGGGGAARAPKQVREIDSVLSASPAIGWGMTETNAIGAGFSGPDYLQRPESSGRVSSVLEFRIINADEAELPAGERGELLVRGTSMFRGYWDRPEANAAAFLEGGWFRTGDVAYLDDEGYLFIVDRIKDLVIRGGENIGCGAVEAAITEHPLVNEVCVYGVPDERLGEEVGATVYADAGLTVDDLRSFLEPRLARFEIPRYIHLSTEPLPRIASGKLFKRALKDEAASRLASV